MFLYILYSGTISDEKKILMKAIFDENYSLTERFLKEAKEYLDINGVIYIELSPDVGKPNELIKIAKKYDYNISLYKQFTDGKIIVNYYQITHKI